MVRRPTLSASWARREGCSASGSPLGDDPQGCRRPPRARRLPRRGMASAEGLGYFVEMVRGDWSAAEVELRRGYDELSAMGDKNYLATVAGWLAHCTYRLGQYDQATAFAEACEGAAARRDRRSGARKGRARDAARTQRRRRRGRGARTHGRRRRPGDRPRRHADRRADEPRRGAAGGRSPCGGRPRRGGRPPSLRAQGGRSCRQPRARPPRRARHRRSRYVGQRPCPVASPE